MGSRWARVARGTSAAGCATFVAALSHTLAGDAAPSLMAIVTTLVMSAAICTLFAGRTLSPWRLAASIALSQALFHGIFSALGMPVAAAHAHTGLVAPPTTPALTHLHAGGAMWIAHAVAALVTIVAFLYAERAFWGISDTARLFFARLFAAIVPVATTPRPTGIRAVRRYVALDLSVLLSTMRHRGPPELAAA
ncbi:hypothetical protein IWX81_000245 [Salinibacterium sp. CAN_S4]|uniref:hypothetical protein n=1 Tax=Salinibacterium sp. CAN_S4 TaxID=2787727 RepID=UPI0018F054B7